MKNETSASAAGRGVGSQEFFALLAFFDGRTSGRQIALFRILLGGLVAYDGLRRLLFVERYWGESGGFPWESVRHFPEHAVSLLRFAPTDPQWTTLVAGLPLACGLLMLVGLFPRAAALVASWALISLHHRNPFVGNGGDRLVVILCFLAALMPLGSRWSLGQMLWRRISPARVRPASSPVWAQRLVQLHVCYVYLYAGVTKVRYPHWWNGEAMVASLSNPEISRFPLPADASGPWLQALTVAICLLTLAVELGFPLLVWFKRIRVPVLLAGIGLHVGIEAAMGIHVFSAAMMLTYVLFLDDEQLSPLLEAPRRFWSRGVRRS